jgi:hypothetical protein
MDRFSHGASSSGDFVPETSTSRPFHETTSSSRPTRSRYGIPTRITVGEPARV